MLKTAIIFILQDTFLTNPQECAWVLLAENTWGVPQVSIKSFAYLTIDIFVRPLWFQVKIQVIHSRFFFS